MSNRNQSDVVDMRPIVKVDVFVSKDFDAAVNCNRELHTGARRRKEVRERYKSACKRARCECN